MILDNNYSLQIDNYNFTLKFEEQRQEIDKKTGHEKTVTSKAEWYFPTLNGALKKYFDETLRPVKEIHDISKAIEHMYRIIDKVQQPK